MLRRVLIGLIFVMGGSPAFANDISVIVDIPTQTMSVTVDGVSEYSWKVSTGRKGHVTPTGDYRPTRMAAVITLLRLPTGTSKYSSFPSRLHAGRVPPVLETCHCPPGLGNGRTKISRLPPDSTEL